MEQSVFTNDEIKKRLSEDFHIVKFNAETRDTILFDGQIYTKDSKEQFHHLAKILAARNNQLVFPTFILLDPDFQVLKKKHQYLSIKQMRSFLSNEALKK